MAENLGRNTVTIIQISTTRVGYPCRSCGEITFRKKTELPPQDCWLCGSVMHSRPTPEEE
jgi:hypothetical protein